MAQGTIDQGQEDAYNAMLNQEMHSSDNNLGVGLGAEDDPIAKWELETNDELERIKNLFLGVEERDGGLRIIGRPVILERGINNLLLPIRSVATKMTSLANFTEEAIAADCTEFRKDVRKKLIYNRKEWGVNKIDRGGIIQTLDTLMYASLTKAKNALLMKIRKHTSITKELIAKRSGQGGGNNIPI